jgi:hypothetical protein
MKSTTVARIKIHGLSIILASFGAGVLSTLAQMLLWLIHGDGVIQSLLRDARFAAAIVMGRGVLHPPVSFDPLIMGVAALVHAFLSFVYCAILALAIHKHAESANIATGAFFGLGLYVINLHGFTAIFPWFIESRGWITFAAHLVFGSAAAIIYLKLIPMPQVPG